MPRRRPSLSAIKIARVVVLLGEDPTRSRLLPPGAAEQTARLLTAAGQLKPWMLSMFRQRWLQRYYAWLDRHTMRGQVLHIALRKRYFEDETRAALTAGATQVLAVGAGFDGLLPRLAAGHPGVTFVEVDHPPTSALKRRALAALGERPTPNLHLVGADLARTSLARCLADLEPWRRGRRSVVLAEGVLMYLPPDAVARFFDTVRAETAEGSRVVYSHLLRSGGDGRFELGGRSRLAELALWLGGEPLRWGPASVEACEAFVAEHGFAPLAAGEDLRRRYLVPAGLEHLPLGGIERLAVAERRADG